MERSSESFKYNEMALREIGDEIDERVGELSTFPK